MLVLEVLQPEALPTASTALEVLKRTTVRDSRMAKDRHTVSHSRQARTDNNNNNHRPRTLNKICQLATRRRAVSSVSLWESRHLHSRTAMVKAIPSSNSHTTSKVLHLASTEATRNSNTINSHLKDMAVLVPEVERPWVLVVVCWEA